MRRYLVLVAFVVALVSCDRANVMEVEVTNPISTDRLLESVELSWSDVQSRLKGVDATNVVVFDGEREIPSQMLYSAVDTTQIEGLLFQVSLGANESKLYGVAVAERGEYESQVYSRYVPERMGDYAWENNLVAYRAYGEPLEVELKTQGVDIWVKRTSNLVIDKWYADGHYHTDSGEGMDCYSVGRTLGGGSSAPIVDNEIVFSCNMVEWQRVANGPIRTEFILKYAPYKAGGKDVIMTKSFSLDANSRFTKVVDGYRGSFDTLDIGVGCMVHTSEDPQFIGDGYLAIYERASDDKSGVGGSIGVAVILPSSEGETQVVSKHLLMPQSVECGDVIPYYIGSGWSKGGVENSQKWFDMVQQESQKISNPLVVTLK
ncbi:MAG: DUF4861 family protein [Rikenellaceae bacterium]